MATTPESPMTDNDNSQYDAESTEEPKPATDSGLGVRIGMSEGEGSTFEPEEDEPDLS
ncbi:MAG: hypothetical protein QOF52_956 [Propionibacteriaceae bacterium]|jgi:hypothetical protein|nr:hypothetical protein [Propionibacteriaceae bacterium]MDX6321098.1 hypothetical protein [Propionibacteriaceae bacterium]